MNGLELFLFLWISMATIKASISLAAIMSTLYEHKKIHINHRLIIYLIIGVFVTFTLSLILWPFMLLSERLLFFCFRNEKAENAVIDYLDLKNNQG